jgi:glycerophosphoryl diester phosphodiesterase
MQRYIYTFFLLVVCSIAWGQQRADAIRRTFLDASSREILVASHRATHNVYPENSLKAIQESIRLGVDIIEIDVKLSIVNKGKKTSYKIPSLEEALELADGKIIVDLDLKTDRLDRIMEVVKRLDMKESVFFFDSDYDALSRIQSANKDFMIMPRAYSVGQADTAILMFDPPVVHIDFSFYNTECAQLIRNSNARIWINSLGDCDRELRAGKTRRVLKKLLGNGATIIQTDEPELLLKALEKYGYRKPLPSLATK